jgi:RNA polymerase sigma-70 factor (ECF subfamily)
MRLARGGRRYSERTVNRSAQADRELVVALRAGDEAAFAWLVDDLSPRLLRAARLYVSTDAAAQEVVQETWLGSSRAWTASRGGRR